MKTKKKIQQRDITITFVEKTKDTKEIKVIPSEPLIDFEKNFIEVKK